MKYCFGVDIGGTTVKLGLFTTDGEIVDKWEIKTRTENQGEAVLPDIAEALKEKLEERRSAEMRWKESESEFRHRLMQKVWYRTPQTSDGDIKK